MPAGQQQVRSPPPGEADLDTLVARAAQRDRGRQEGHRAGERYQHPGAGNHPKLGHALEIGRHKRKKSRRRGKRRDQNGTARASRGQTQRLPDIDSVVFRLAEAHGELECEINRDADEQHTKSYRNQVERTDGDRRDQQRQHQAKPECAEYRHDQSPGAHRQKQPQCYQNRADDEAGDGPLGNRRELDIGERHRTGDP